MTFEEFIMSLNDVKKSVKKRCKCQPADIEFWLKNTQLEIEEISHFHVKPDVVIHFKKPKEADGR